MQALTCGQRARRRPTGRPRAHRTIGALGSLDRLRSLDRLGSLDGLGTADAHLAQGTQQP